MVPYYLLFGYLGALALIENLRKTGFKYKEIYLVTLFLLVIFIGFRRNVGLDIYEYKSYFELVSNSKDYSDFENNVLAAFSRIEIGYYYLNYLFSLFGSFELMVFSVSAFNLYVLNKFLAWAKIKNKISFLCIIYSISLFREFDVIRQSIALSIYIVSLMHVHENKKYYLLNLIGSMFHVSALVFLIIPYFLRRTISKTLIRILAVLYFMSMWHSFPFVSGFINTFGSLTELRVFQSAMSFFEYLNFSKKFSPTIDLPCIVFVAYLLIKYEVYSGAKTGAKVVINNFLILIILFVFFGEISEITNRLGYYFYFGIAGMFCVYYDTIKGDIGKVAAYLPLVFSLLKLSLIMLSYAASISYAPYQNYLFTQEDYSYDLLMERKRATLLQYDAEIN